MQTINLPQVRLVQLQTLTEGVLQITEPLTEVAAQVQAAAAAFVDFQEGMTKSTSASNKKTLDRTRDVINSGFFKSVEAFLALRKGETWVFGKTSIARKKGYTGLIGVSIRTQQLDQSDNKKKLSPDQPEATGWQ